MTIENATSQDVLERRLVQLRTEFDLSFARPVRTQGDRENSVLCLMADGERLAIALPDLQSVSRASPIVALPSRAPGLLGLTVMRAQVVPVYSISGVAGSGERHGECHWLAVLRGPDAVALAIESLDGYAVADDQVSAEQESMPRFVTAMVKHGGNLYGIIDGKGLYDAITQVAVDSEKGQDTKL